MAKQLTFFFNTVQLILKGERVFEFSSFPDFGL